MLPEVVRLSESPIDEPMEVEVVSVVSVVLEEDAVVHTVVEEEDAVVETVVEEEESTEVLVPEVRVLSVLLYEVEVVELVKSPVVSLEVVFPFPDVVDVRSPGVLPLLSAYSVLLEDEDGSVVAYSAPDVVPDRSMP